MSEREDNSTGTTYPLLATYMTFSRKNTDKAEIIKAQRDSVNPTAINFRLFMP